MSEQLTRVMKKARAFARANLGTGAKELQEWGNTSILPNGVVRELAQILKHIDASNSLGLAKSLFESEAKEFVKTFAIHDINFVDGLDLVCQVAARNIPDDFTFLEEQTFKETLFVLRHLRDRLTNYGNPNL